MENTESFGFFVTGTDTGVGKTVITSALLYSLVQLGWKSCGMKPVASGAVFQDGRWCNEDVEALRAVSNVALPIEFANLPNPYLFKLAAAPHIAAQQEQQQINLETILRCYYELKEYAQAIVVEGVGGFKVPLNAKEDTADMAQQLQLPVILVVDMRLGCINQALLTTEAIAARGLKLAGWVANSAQEEMLCLSENLLALRERIPAPMLGYIPRLGNPTPAEVADKLDLKMLFQ